MENTFFYEKEVLENTRSTFMQTTCFGLSFFFAHFPWWAGSSVGIAADYGLDGPGIEFW
jgi:hypothetical protein